MPHWLVIYLLKMVDLSIVTIVCLPDGSMIRKVEAPMAHSTCGFTMAIPWSASTLADPWGIHWIAREGRPEFHDHRIYWSISSLFMLIYVYLMFIHVDPNLSWDNYYEISNLPVVPHKAVAEVSE